MSVRRPNYAQRWLLPPSVDEWVPEGHPVRFVSDFVDAVDLSEHGIAEPTGEVGRPPVAADVLLKIWLYGFTQRIRSPRKLEKACVEVMPFLWLTGNDPPDHNTIWRFFQKNHKALKGLLKTLMRAAAEAKLLSFVLHALDGTKLQAASSTDKALHRKSIEEKLKLLEQVIAQYMTEVKTEASSEDGGAQEMPKEMQDLEARRQKIRELLARRLEDREDGLRKEPEAPEPKEPPAPSGADKSAGAEASGKADAQAAESPDDKRVPPPAPSAAESPQDEAADSAASRAAPPAVDPMQREAETLRKELQAKLDKLNAADADHLADKEPEARMMKGRAMSALGYNAQIVVDHDSDLIVACDVTAQCNDLKQLTPMLGLVRETYGRVADETVADGGYDSGAELARAEAQHLPVLVRLREEPDAKGQFSKAHFRYDAHDNVYLCPRGEKLIQIGSNRSRASAEQPDAIYRCHHRTCPVRQHCSTDPRGRKIRRPLGEEARERQAQKQQHPPAMLQMSLRKEIVEHLFGILKIIDGFRRFTVRGLEKVNAQWALVCLAANLRKLAAMARWYNGTLVPLAAAHAAAAG
jgi:transposase